MNQQSPVTAHEIMGVAILSLGFGLVGIDRFLISTMYPTIARDLHLGLWRHRHHHRRAGHRLGHRGAHHGQHGGPRRPTRVLVGALIAFSLLIGLSGLAKGLAGLVLVRFMMGFADGAFTPASIAATIQLSPAERHGRNVGFQQTMLVLFGLGLSPLMVGALLSHGVDWRYIFSLFLAPDCWSRG